MKRIVINIGELVGITDSDKRFASGADMQKLNTISDAFLTYENGIIVEFGKMADLGNMSDYEEITDAKGQMVFPAFVDSHTHLVYAGSREIEYIDKIKGLSYEEIAKRGGGILNSAKLLHETSEDELFEQSLPRIYSIMSMGTGAVEIKSGYGLTTNDELKMLRVIRRLNAETPILIKATFLGAHAVPAEFKGRQSDYVKLIIDEMLPKVVDEGLADFVDVFCDKGFFTTDETHDILNAATKLGLKPKIHANELDYSGGIEVGVAHNALSVDHLEYTGNAEIMALLKSETMPTILPGAAFFLGMKYAPARKMIDAGLPVALASDFNPGSSPSGNMQLIASMGCILYKMLPEEVINATTINTAYAMNIADKVGSIAIGKQADFYIAKPMPSYSYLPYSYGDNKVERMFIKGELIRF
ncbi:MAG: imidazolonepropionase [Bacteroidales bacterium]|nr:imidazolonepropionase [Bacteroidales bacterium]